MQLISFKNRQINIENSLRLENSGFVSGKIENNGNLDQWQQSLGTVKTNNDSQDTHLKLTLFTKQITVNF